MKSKDCHLAVPPMIDGVSPSKVYLEKLTNNPDTIFNFLCDKFRHISADEWLSRFDDGLVLDENFCALDLSTAYQHGRSIYYYRFVYDEIKVPFCHQVIFENQEFMVVDKPHFLAVTPSGSYVRQTLLTRLKASTNNQNLSPIHRLDRETAGLILISKNPNTRHIYQKLFVNHQINKTYHAIAAIKQNLTMPTELSLHLERGEPFYTMVVNPAKPPNTHTHIDIIEQRDGMAKYELRPTTGKLHQLRVHLNHLGVPIKNDPYYPSVHHKAKDDFSQPLQLLAKSLTFIDPMTGENMAFYSERNLDLTA